MAVCVLESGLRTIHVHVAEHNWQCTEKGCLHRRQCHRGPDPQYLTSRGPSMCWTPAIIPTQSRVWCTIFVNIIDCMVSAVIEQVYSITFKFCLSKIQEISPVKKTLHFPLNAPKCVWLPGSARTRWGSLQYSPRSPSWIKRGGWERGGREGRKEGGGRRKGEHPQCLKCIDASGYLHYKSSRFSGNSRFSCTVHSLKLTAEVWTVNLNYPAGDSNDPVYLNFYYVKMSFQALIHQHQKPHMQ